MKHYITQSGYDKLISELSRLTTTEQRQASEMLREARDKGDLSENAEFTAAKEFQENLSNKISKLQIKIRESEIISHTLLPKDCVNMISTVEIRNHKLNADQIWTLVSENEVDTKVGKISFNSPIGSALIGKKIGDVVEVVVPSGVMKLEILKIK